MGIISISRELAALGDETARELAKQLGYRFVDKHTLEERIKSFGVDEEKLKKYDERKPSFISALSQDRDDYLHYIKTAILAEAEQGNCVLIGRGVRSVLKNVPAHIGVFLTASPEIRIERVKSYFHCDEIRAQQIIERSDHDRSGFHRYFFEINWKDPGNYHLALNTGTLSPMNCADIIRQLTEWMFTPEAEAKSVVRLKELILEQKIKQHILYEKEIRIHFLEVAFTGNTITLYGVTNSQAMVETTLEAAREAAGTNTVQSEMQIVHEYSLLP